MPEPCNPNDCPLEPRITALERANEQHGQTHRELFKRMNGVEKDNAVQDAHYRSITGKLDEISATVKALAEKPSKRWETLVSCLISSLAGAFIIWMAMGMPGVGS